MITFRALQAFATSATGTVGAGAIADVYPPRIRGNAMGWYAVTVLIGPVIGPVGGGAVAQFLGWRAIFLSVSGLGAVFLAVVFFILPETAYRGGMIRPINPLNTLKLTLQPGIFVIALLSCAIFGPAILAYFIFPLELDDQYSLNDLEIGLSFLPFGLGLFTGTRIGGRFADMGYRWHKKVGRLIPVAVGVFTYCLFLIAFGLVVKWNYIALLAATGGLGFFMTFSRPGMFTFAIEQRPSQAGAVSGAIYSVQFFAAFVALTLGPIAADYIHYAYVFGFLGILGIYAWCVLIFAMALYYYYS